MNVGLLIITHNDTGKGLLDTATRIFGCCPLEARTIDVPYDGNPEQLKSEAYTLIEQLNRGDGVLVLTDMYGSTPGNIATALCQEKDINVNVVAGINLPMLVRVFNYADLDLSGITDSAITGGKKSIMQCKPK